MAIYSATTNMTKRQLPKPKDFLPLIGFRAPRLDRNQARLDTATNLWDLRSIAKKRTPRAVFDYTDGAAGAEESMKRSREIYSRIEFNPRVLRDVSNVDTSVEILGKKSAFPIVLGPTGFTRMMHYQGEVAVAQAAGDFGLPYCLSTLGTTSIEEVAENAPKTRKMFQLYVWRDRGPGKELIDRAKAMGYDTLILTVDCPVGGPRLRDVKNGLTIPPSLKFKTMMDMAKYPNWWFNLLTTEPLTFASFSSTQGTVSELLSRVMDPSLSFADVEWLRSQWQGPLVIKGVQTVADSKVLADMGVDGILLSNHGGRQLDRAKVPFELLPDVVEKVGSEIEVFVDGGTMNGADVAAAVARGARAVFIGRAYLYGLMAGGKAGVERALQMLTKEFTDTMKLLGASDVSELDESLVSVRPKFS